MAGLKSAIEFLGDEMVRIGRKLIIAIALAWICSVVYTPPAQSQSWSNGYVFRRAITIDHTKVPNSDQTNFPILVSGTYSYLATVANGGNVTSANGYDIVFTSDAAGTTALAYERESYSSTTGAVLFWVKVPTLSHTSDAVIYMFYGNGAVTADQSNKTGTWDSNFAGVWHLPNGSTLAASDSTSNGNNGTITGATAVSGKFNGGANFSGSSQYIDAGNGTSVQITGSSMTVEAWLNTSLSNPNQYKRIIAKEMAGNSDPWITYCLCRIQGTNQLNFGVSHGTAGSNVGVTSVSSITMGAWTHVVGAYDGAHLQIYLNGVLNAQAAETGNIGN